MLKRFFFADKYLKQINNDGNAEIEIVKTKEGIHTLVNNRINEHYHSLHWFHAGKHACIH
jgi:hypothetical protein